MTRIPSTESESRSVNGLPVTFGSGRIKINY